MKHHQTLLQVLKRQEVDRPILIKDAAPTEPVIQECGHGQILSAYDHLFDLSPMVGQAIVREFHHVIVRTTDGTTHYPALWIVC